MYTPTINVLVRTSNRPVFFGDCYRSIQEQTYTNIRTIVSFDDLSTSNYVKNYDIDLFLEVLRIKTPEPQKGQIFYPGYIAKPFPADLYLNKMLRYCQPGYVVILDDDKYFTSPDSLQTITSKLINQHQMVLWRVQFPGYLIPDNQHFNQNPKPCQIDMSGFAFHTDYLKHCVFDGYTFGDYRAAQNLFMYISRKEYINEPLVSLQANPGKGLRKDKNSNLKFH